MLKKIIVILLFILCPVSVHSNENTKSPDISENADDSTTTVAGNIYNALTGRLLPGADINIKDTAFGTASDDNGKYIFESLPLGKYNLTVSYIGYQTAERKVEATAQEKNIVNIELYPVVIQGKPIEITAQAEGQLKAINRQLAAKAIVNHVSASRIEELPDANAAEAVARLPGVSLLREGGEGQKVIIRGMSAKYNTVTINGVPLASADYDDRSIDLSMIPPDILAGIEVTKAITADQDADAIGGSVNFELKDASLQRENDVNDLHLQFQAQGGYNELKNSYGNYKYTGMYRNRFFDRRLGLLAQAYIERKNLGSNELGASYYLNGPELNAINPTLLNRLNLSDISRDKQRIGGILVADYVLPAGRVSLTNFYSMSETSIQKRNEAFSIDSDDHNYNVTDTRTKIYTTTNILNYEVPISSVNINTKFAHSYSQQKSPDALSFFFNQTAVGLYEADPQINPENIQDYANDSLNLTYLTWIDQIENEAEERQLSASLQFETDFLVSKKIFSKLKWGGKYTYRNRSYDQNLSQGYYHVGSAQDARQAILDNFPWMKETVADGNSNLPLSLFIDKDYNYGNFLEGRYTMGPAIDIDLMRKVHDVVKTAGSTNQSYFTNDFLSSTHDYSGEEKLSAGFIQSEFQIGSQVTIAPGLRYEQLNTSYKGVRGNFTGILTNYPHYDTTMTRNHEFWLPVFHLKYKPLKWFDVRFAYTHTLSYPDYRNIIPRINSTFDGFVDWNNANLKPSRSENFDLYCSFYSNTIGLFTVGGFIKNIDDFIFPLSGRIIIDAGGYEGINESDEGKLLYTNVNNPYKVYVQGIELDWQTHFFYLPGLLSGLVLNVNYTHIFSRAKYPRPVLNVTHLFEPPWVIKENVNSFYRNRLIDQPDDIINLAMGYDYKGFSARLSMLYQDNVFKADNFWPELRQISDDYLRWDLAVKQDLPWTGFQLFGNISNIFNEKDRDLIKGSLFPAVEQYYGSTANFGLRYSF